MKVTIIQKGRQDKEGRIPLQIRIADGPTRSFKPTRIKVTEDQFKDGKVVDHPRAKRLNQILRDLVIRHESDQLIPKGRFPGGDFRFYCLDNISKWERTKKGETIRQHRSELNKLTFFRNRADLQDITPDFLNKYVEHLYGIGNKTNTVWKSLKFMRLIMRKAHREKLIPENPFDLFEMPKYKDPKKAYLTQEQISLIEAYRGPYERVSTWFVLCCYTGLRYGDAKAFDRKRDIKNNRIVITTGKTNEVVGMPLSDKLKALFERINYKPLPYTNKHCNDIIRAVAAEVGVEQEISWHQSRHTAAVRWADAGIGIEVTARLLGHRSIRTTAIYYQITNKKIDEELSKVS